MCFINCFFISLYFFWHFKYLFSLFNSLVVNLKNFKFSIGLFNRNCFRIMSICCCPCSVGVILSEVDLGRPMTHCFFLKLNGKLTFNFWSNKGLNLDYYNINYLGVLTDVNGKSWLTITCTSEASTSSSLSESIKEVPAKNNKQGDFKNYNRYCLNNWKLSYEQQYIV